MSIDLEKVYSRSPVWLQTLFMNAYAWRIERHRHGRPVRSMLTRLLKQEIWPIERIRAHQDERLRAIVRHAYEHSRYYRQLFDDNRLHPGDIKGVSDLPLIPLLTKETVRACQHDIMTQQTPARGWIEGHTSGTTGSPLAIWCDRDTCIVNNSMDWRQKVWGGMAQGDWVGLFLGRVIVPQRQSRPPFWRANAVQRQVLFSSFHMSEENLGSYVEEIRRRRLAFLEGYPSTLFILGRYLLANGLKLPMKAVFSSSETLHAVQREIIEEAFECPLFDFYGLAERVIFACECEAHSGKHLCEEYGITEIVDEEGQSVSDGRRGYLVGTSLHNLAMPMIRYRTSDVSSILQEPCSCGRTHRRIEDVTTKAEDIVVTPDGRMISPSILTHPFKPLTGIVKSQIIQDRADHIIIKLVPTADVPEDDIEQLLQSLRTRVGSEMEIEIRIVDDVPPEPSGKFRWVISHVDHLCVVEWSGVAEHSH